MPRSQSENENVQFVQELAEVDGPFESPININYRDLTKLELPSLCWNRIDSWPKKMKITNTGHTVIISGKWKSERPYLTGGPLTGKYVFSQIHFHWGQDESKGSEHQICGEGFPLEMHVAHFKTDYLSQENALKEKDGMVVLVYLFKLQDKPNDAFKKILNLLPNVKQPCTSQALEPKPILTLVNPFKDDYFMYWGSVITPTCAHILLWLICREPFGISREQVDEFRKIMDSSQRPICKNNRDVQPVHKRNVFHVNAMRDLDSPLLPIKQMLECYCKGGPDEGTPKMAEPDASPPPPCPPPPASQNECNCAVYYRNQEDIEGGNKTKIMCSSIIGNRKPNSSLPRSSYLKQYVYVLNAVTTPAPFLAKKYESEMIKKVHYSVGKQTKSEDTFRANRVTQSCCFYPIEKANQIKPRLERRKNREKKKSNSFRAFSNILNSLEALKNHTFKKLKEIEAINQEIKGMKSVCDTAEDKRWLRKIEKVMTSQKHFTIKKSQNCFSELKKLAKECTLDKLFDSKQFPIGRNCQEIIPIKNSENDQTNPVLICPESYARKENAGDHSFNQDLKYSIKAQKLIQSFFEDIKDTEDLQNTVRKNLEFKKIESTHNKEAGDSNQVNFKGYITEKMFIMGNLGDRFFTEVTTEVETEEEKVEEVIFAVEESMKNQENRQIDNKKGGKSIDNNHDLIIPLHKTTELPKLNESSDEFENYFSITDNQFPNLISLSDMETTSDHENLIKIFGDKKLKKKNTVRKELDNYLKKLNDLTEEKFKKELITDDTLASMWYSNSNFLTDSTETQRMFIAKFRNKRSRRDLWKRKSSVIAKLSSKRIFDKSHRKSKVKNFSIEGYYLKKKKHSKNTHGGSSCDMSSTSRETAVIVNKSKWKRLVKAQLKLGLENSSKHSSGSEMECKIISPKRKKLKLDNKKKNAIENTPPKKSKDILTNTETKAIDYQEAVVQTKNDRGEQVVLPTDDSERYREAITQTALSNVELRPSDGNFRTKSVRTIAAETTCDLKKSKTLNSCSGEIKILVESRKIPSKKLLVKNKSLTCLTKPSRFFSSETTQRFFVENLDARRKSLRDSFEMKKPPISPRLNETVGKSDETSKKILQIEGPGLESATEVKDVVPEAEYNVYFFKNLPKQVEKEFVPSNSIKREKSKIPLVKQWKHKEVNGSKTKPIEEKSSEIQKESLKANYVKSIKKDDWQESMSFSKSHVSRSLSGESLNSLSRPIKRKNKKRPLICKRNSKQFIRKNSLIIRKPNKLDSRPLYRAGLPREEQVKQEVERYIIQNFVGFEGKPEEEKNKMKELERAVITDVKPNEENPKETNVKEASTVTEEAKQDAGQVVKKPRQGIPRLKRDIKPKVPPCVTPRGNPPPQKPVHDFVKLNKLMAGKFRRGPPRTQKPNEVKIETKRVLQKKETINSNEQKNISQSQPVLKPAEKRENILKAAQKCEKTQKLDEKEKKPETAKCSPSGMEVQKMALPKTRLLPAYMMTSYLPPPMEIVHNQKKEMNRYLMNPDMGNFSPDGLKENLKQEKLSDFVYKKDLEYLLRLQNCIHGEISTGVENPMNYVKTLLGQEYSGPTVLADTLNEPFDYCKPLHYSDSRNSGLVLIEMSDFLESSTSNSDLSGYFKLKPIESLSQQLKNKIYVKKVPQESGDPGIVNPIINHNVQEDWCGDTNYDCQIFITLSANETECGTSLSAAEENSTRTQELTNQSSTYSEISSSQSITMKQHRKKRKDHEISVEMKRKLLEILETEIKREMGVEWSGPGDAPSEGQMIKSEDGEGNQRSQSFDNIDVLAEISETMRQYLSGFKEGKLPRNTGGGE